jgi:phytoene dehydrogenase-like protein
VPDAYRARLQHLEPSIEALNISLVTDLDLPALGFGFETLFFDSWDMEHVWRSMESGQVGIYSFTLTTAVDPSLAPRGQHLVSALCNLPAAVKRVPEAVRGMGARLFAEIGKAIPDLTDHLVFAREGSPPDGYIMQEFGPIYGWAASPRQIGMGRLGQRTPIRGLYLVGHWTQPGHGVLAVILSGMALVKLILR